jgi:hypothetical protein
LTLGSHEFDLADIARPDGAGPCDRREDAIHRFGREGELTGHPVPEGSLVTQSALPFADARAKTLLLSSALLATRIISNGRVEAFYSPSFSAHSVATLPLRRLDEIC